MSPRQATYLENPSAFQGIGPALIVLDVQRGFDDASYWGERNNPRCEENIAALLAGWRRAGRPVIFVRHDSREPGSPLAPGQPGNAFKDVVDGEPDVLVVLVLVALPGAGLRAEAALQASGNAGRRAAGLRVARSAAMGGPVAVAARPDALGLAARLREVGRPRGVAEALLLVAPGELEQLVEGAGLVVDVGRGIADCAQAVGHGVEPQVARLHVGHLVPAHGARHARVRRGAHGVAGGDRAVAGVLVVVDEHAVALLLPPLARGEGGRPALDLPRERQRGEPDLAARDLERRVLPLGQEAERTR